MDFLSHAKKRRSYRKYKPDQISKLDIEKVIEAGTWAPSAHNQQPWRFVVLTDVEKIKIASKAILDIKKKLNTGVFRDVADPIFYEAPCVILICVEKPKGEWGEMDVGMCAQNAFLQATELGLGTVAVGPSKLLEQIPETKKELGIPDEWEVVLGFALGYPEKELGELPRKKIEVQF